MKALKKLLLLTWHKLIVNLILVYLYVQAIALIAIVNITLDPVDYDITPNFTKPQLSPEMIFQGLLLIFLGIICYLFMVFLIKKEIKITFLIFNLLGFIYFWSAPVYDIYLLITNYNTRQLLIFGYDFAVLALCAFSFYVLIYMKDNQLSFIKRYLR